MILDALREFLQVRDLEIVYFLLSEVNCGFRISNNLESNVGYARARLYSFIDKKNGK